MTLYKGKGKYIKQTTVEEKIKEVAQAFNELEYPKWYDI